MHNPPRALSFFTALLCLGLVLPAGPAWGVPEGPSRRRGGEPVLEPGPAPVVAMDTAALRLAARQPRALVQGFQRADFMEDTPEEVALENERNPYQAWALAFFPTALVKGVTLGLAFSMAKEESWAAFLPMVPSMGLSHFIETGVTWAGLIALGGDLIGGALCTVYFNQYHSWGVNGGTKPSDTMLWAGIGVIAAFFVYENISAPLLSSWQNKRLRRQFVPAKDRGRPEAWRHSPLPDRPLASIGPGEIFRRSAAPIGTGWTFTF